MGNYNVVKTTTNRSVFNRAYKELVCKNTGDCTFCNYHKGENSRNKYYYFVDINDCRYPNWKLSTFNKKQWMAKEKKTLKNTKTGKRYSKRDFFDFNAKGVIARSPLFI